MRKLQEAPKRFENFIGGQWLPPSTGDSPPNRNPADLDDVIGQFPVSGLKDVQAAVAAAAEAFPRWSATPGPARGRILAQAVQIFRSRLDEIARVLCREEGKTLAEARGEVNKG